MTDSELAKKLEKELEVETSSSKSGLASSMAFPISKDAENAIASFKDKSSVMVALKMDLSTESLQLLSSSSDGLGIETAKAAIVTTTEPLYVLFSFADVSQGEDAATIFVFYCPEDAHVKQRMVSSTAKGKVIEALTEYGVAPAIKVHDASFFPSCNCAQAHVFRWRFKRQTNYRQRISLHSLSRRETR